MMMEALSWYVETLSTFWVSLAGGGLFKLILIGCIIYWVCGGPMRWRCHRHRCSHCGCRCGHCPCGAAEDGDEEDGDDKDEEVV